MERGKSRKEEKLNEGGEIWMKKWDEERKIRKEGRKRRREGKGTL